MFPNLLEMVYRIAVHNGFTMKGDDPTWFDEIDHWPPVKRSRLEWYDWLAGYMQRKEVEIFCTGKEDEVLKIAKAYCCHDLHDFLNEVYEGEYYDFFFMPPGLLTADDE